MSKSSEITESLLLIADLRAMLYRCNAHPLHDHTNSTYGFVQKALLNAAEVTLEACGVDNFPEAAAQWVGKMIADIGLGSDLRDTLASLPEWENPSRMVRDRFMAEGDF